MLSRHPWLPGAPISGHIILNRWFHTTGVRMEEVRGGNGGRWREVAREGGEWLTQGKQVWDVGLEARRGQLHGWMCNLETAQPLTEKTNYVVLGFFKDVILIPDASQLVNWREVWMMRLLSFCSLFVRLWHMMVQARKKNSLLIHSLIICQFLSTMYSEKPSFVETQQTSSPHCPLPVGPECVCVCVCFLLITATLITLSLM